jgi:NADH:ubiquinone oxidoreductase subunit E
MKEKYIEFELVLGNGEKCKIRYCDEWGCSLFGNRTVHFEFRDCLSISHTGYRSEFRVVEEDYKFDPKEAAKQIIEQMTGIKFSGKNVQQKLL